MKKNKLFLLITILFSLIFSFSFNKNNNPLFYYSYNEKIILTESPNKIVVTSDTLLDNNQFDGIINSITNNYDKKKSGNVTIIQVETEEIASRLIGAFKSNKHVLHVSKVLLDKNNTEMSCNNEILLKFKKNIAEKYRDSLLDRFNLKKSAANDIFDKLIVLDSKEDVLSVANQIQESGLVIFSHPNFLIERIYCNYIPNDPYFNKQFYLYNTGQQINDGRSGTTGADIKATEAWDITKGNNNITIAVLDMGVTSNHPDLPNTRQIRLAGSNYYGTNPNDPSPNNALDFHGDASAGIIAATQDNNEGISGIAPNCKIMPINIGGLDITYVNVSVLSSAINFARVNGADVIYNGWSTSGGYPNQFPAIVDAINNAVTNGRSGKGCVVIFVPLNGVGYVSFPANVEVGGVLSVGASDRNDNVAAYSPWCRWFPSNTSYPMFGQLIDIVAPSHKAYSTSEGLEVWTMDNPNTNGANPYPADSRFYHPPVAGEQLPPAGSNFQAYTGRFGGTSAAGPQVAGAAALLLSLNPNLTQQQVFNLLTTNADKVGGYDYNYYITNPNSQHYADYGRSREMGYGRLNIFKALCSIYSPSLSISGVQSFCSGTQNYTVANVLSTATATWSVSPTGIATLGNTVGLSTSLTAVGAGFVTLTATINQCAQQPVVVNYSIHIGSYTSSDYTLSASGPGSTGSTQPLYWCPNQTYSFTISGGNASNYQWTIPSGWTLNYQSNYLCVLKAPASSYPPTGQVEVTFTEPCGTPITKSFFIAYSSSSCSGTDPRFTFSPNPAPSYLYVAVASGYTSTTKIQRIQIINTSNYITVFDQSYGTSGTLSAYVTTSGFQSGTYTLRIYDGTTWAVYQFVR